MSKQLVIDPDVNNAWKRLTEDTSETSWVTCGYPNDGNKLEFLSEGTGGLPEFLEQLKEDVVWGAFKVVGVDDRGNLVSRRPKFIFVKYLPTSAPTMKRARAGNHKGAIKAVLNGHVDIEIESREDLTEDEVIKKLRAAGGAHQPTSYEFHSYSSSPPKEA